MWCFVPVKWIQNQFDERPPCGNAGDEPIKRQTDQYTNLGHLPHGWITGKAQQGISNEAEAEQHDIEHRQPVVICSASAHGQEECCNSEWIQQRCQDKSCHDEYRVDRIPKSD